jgi:hypothetical protein
MAGMVENWWGAFSAHSFLAILFWGLVVHLLVEGTFYDRSQKRWVPVSELPGTYWFYVVFISIFATFISVLLLYGVITGTFPQEIWNAKK